MITTRQQVLSLYRTILRRSKTFAIPQIRRKICFNIRDAIEFYKPTTNPVQIKELIDYGRLFDRILQNISSLPSEHIKFLISTQYGQDLYKQGITDLRKWEKTLNKQN